MASSIAGLIWKAVSLIPECRRGAVPSEADAGADGLPGLCARRAGPRRRRGAARLGGAPETWERDFYGVTSR